MASADMFRLDGKVALVTGAGQGLGVGIARTLARQGARVIVNDRDAARAQATAAALKAEGLAVAAAPFDVTDRDQVTSAVAAIQRDIGPVDILVNNAGNAGGYHFAQKDFARSDPAEWDRFIDVNLRGVLNCTHAVAARMCDRGWGRIVTISSIAGRMGSSIRVSLYGAAKAGAMHFMRHLSQEVGPHGVTANAIALGFMNTMTGDYAEAVRKTIPAGRLGTGEDVGAAVLFLASNEAGWVNGSVMTVDGGSAPF